MVDEERYQMALDRITVLENQVEDYGYREEILRKQIEELDGRLCEIIRLQNENAGKAA